MITILIFLNLINFHSEENYQEIFADHYKAAVEIMNNKKDHIDSLAERYQVNGDLTPAIVFPELIRYSIIRDILERNSLEIVYVNTGKADFSIGPLQIKPSFAEKIEDLVLSEPELSEFREKFQYSSNLSVEQRKERLHRLKDFDFQLHYVVVFQRFIENKFLWDENTGQEYKLRFLSTAYNHDFTASKQKIESFMNRAYFPWGIHNDRRKYNYADVSWYYYCHEINDICELSAP